MDKSDVLETLADSILRAAGSSLSNYTMPGTRQAIMNAVSCAVQSGANTRSPVTDEMVEVRIGILGCDDSTYLTRQMTKEQFTFLEEVAEQISEQSTYGCMPVMNAALTAALGGPHG